MIRLNWKLTIFSLFFFVSFLKLGFWQLDRRTEKLEMISANEELRARPGIVAVDISNSTETGTPVVLNGTFNHEIILLLDNKTLNAVVGFEVLQLFEDRSGLNFIVNRGFIPAGRTRSAELKIPKIDGSVELLLGNVYKQKPNPYALEPERVDYKFPQIVQKVEVPELSKAIDKQISPFIIRLKNNQVGALPRGWQLININPEKHQAYAVQWFLMSLAILIAWLSFTIRFKKDERNHK